MTKQEITLAEQIIKLHDGENYDLIRDMLFSPPTEDEQKILTEKKYLDMCEDILRERGLLEHIEYIDCLERKESYLTLWKVLYTSDDDEVFWSIGFDRTTHKVLGININW